MSLRVLGLLLFTLAFQSLAAPLYEIEGARPDFLLAATSLALVANGSRALVAALVAALLADLASVDPLGTRALALLPALVLLRAVRRSGHLDALLARAVFVVASVGLTVAARMALLSAFERVSPAWRLEFSSLLYTIASLIPLAGLLRPWLEAASGRRPGARARWYATASAG